jgi:hypothetical protein
MSEFGFLARITTAELAARFYCWEAAIKSKFCTVTAPALGNFRRVVNGIGTLRNRLSDSHGRGGKPVKPSPRHASLAVNTAGAIATFLIETYLEKKPKA